jgi:hypothetical protein
VLSTNEIALLRVDDAEVAEGVGFAGSIIYVALDVERIEEVLLGIAEVALLRLDDAEVAEYGGLRLTESALSAGVERL